MGIRQPYNHTATSNMELQDWNDELKRNYTLSTCIQVLYLIIGLTGNFLVIVIYKLKINSKNSDRYFIPIIAVIDLMGCIFSTTLSLLQNVRSVTFPGSHLCKIIQFGTCTSIVASLFMLLVISIQRYQKICRPFGFQMNLKHKRIAMGVAVLTACILSVPMLFLYQKVEVTNHEKNITGYICGSAPGTTKFGDIMRAVLIAVEVGSVFSMSIFYIMIGKRLIHQFKMARKLRDIQNTPAVFNVSCNHENVQNTNPRMTDSSQSTSQEEHDESDLHKNDSKKPQISNQQAASNPDKTVGSGRRYSIMFMVISIVAIVCYIPPWTFVILEAKYENFWTNLSFVEQQIFLIIRRLYIVNHIANPFIYGFFDTKFKQEVKKMICRCKCR